MSAPSKWITFVGPRPSASGKTQIWAVCKKEDAQGVRPLGFVGFYPKWRRYAFQPQPDTVFESDCLRDIATFCEDETRKWKGAR